MKCSGLNAATGEMVEVSFAETIELVEPVLGAVAEENPIYVAPGWIDRAYPHSPRLNCRRFDCHFYLRAWRAEEGEGKRDRPKRLGLNLRHCTESRWSQL